MLRPKHGKVLSGIEKSLLCASCILTRSTSGAL